MKRILPLAWILEATSACAASGARGAGPDPPAQVQVLTVTVPRATGIYGSHPPVPPSTAERFVGARLRTVGLGLDPGLSAAARDVARIAPGRDRIPASLVEGVLARHGVPDPPPRLLVVETEPGRGRACDPVGRACREMLRSLAEAAAAQAKEAGHPVVGVGAARTRDGRLRVVAAVADRAVQLDPFPMEAPVGGGFVLSGRILGPRHGPWVEVALPDGGVQRLSVVPRGDGAFDVRIRCRRRGEMRVELLVEGPHGPEVAANAPVGCGRSLPEVFRVEVETVPPDADPVALARANFQLLQRERARRGLGPLAWDPVAARVARSHAEEMAAAGYVGHVSPRTGDAAARLARAGHPARVVRENVARGYGPREIHGSLLRSPGHRANLLAADVTAVGIGAAVGDREGAASPRPIYLVQVFLRPPMSPGADPTAALRRALEPLPGGAVWSDRLASLARRDARSLARTGRRIRLTPADFARAGTAGVVRSEMVAEALDDLAEADLWEKVRGEVGFHVAQRPDGAFVLVVYEGRTEGRGRRPRR